MSQLGSWNLLARSAASVMKARLLKGCFCNRPVTAFKSTAFGGTAPPVDVEIGVVFLSLTDEPIEQVLDVALGTHCMLSMTYLKKGLLAEVWPPKRSKNCLSSWKKESVNFQVSNLSPN